MRVNYSIDIFLFFSRERFTSVYGVHPSRTYVRPWSWEKRVWTVRGNILAKSTDWIRKDSRLLRKACRSFLVLSSPTTVWSPVAAVYQSCCDVYCNNMYTYNNILYALRPNAPHLHTRRIMWIYAWDCACKNVLNIIRFCSFILFLFERFFVNYKGKIIIHEFVRSYYKLYKPVEKLKMSIYSRIIILSAFLPSPIFIY